MFAYLVVILANAAGEHEQVDAIENGGVTANEFFHVVGKHVERQTSPFVTLSGGSLKVAAVGGYAGNSLEAGLLVDKIVGLDGAHAFLFAHVKEGAKVNEGQRKALEYMAEKMRANGGTGIQRCIEEAAFKMLDLITVYPVEDENKFTDHFGRVLPDAFLVPRGSTARDLAYRIHTDLGEKFIRAVNAKTKRTVGADYELQDGDVIRIVANK